MSKTPDVPRLILRHRVSKAPLPLPWQFECGFCGRIRRRSTQRGAIRSLEHHVQYGHPYLYELATRKRT
jgi:hypothetical protein